jgi:hypothetical protein
MEISRAAKAALAQLNGCDGHLTHAEVLVTVNFYDPAIQGFGERVEMEAFVYLRDNRLITKMGRPDVGPGEQRYKINEAGRVAISTATGL